MSVKSSTKLICKLFKLDKINTISAVESKILTKKVSDPVVLTAKDKKNGIVLYGDDAKYNYNWESSSEPEELNIATSNGSEPESAVQIKFITTIAKLEYSKQKKRDANDQYLPKSQRINDAFVKVVFFELDNFIYFVICTSQQVNIDRVIRLIGSKEINKTRSEFTFPEDFFNWIFYQFSERNRILGDNYYLKGIGGFMGNVSDDQNVIKGISEQTSELTVTKAFISNGESLKNVTARVKKENEIDIVFGIDHECNSVIYVTQSANLMLFETTNKDNLMLVYLYGVLIPKLRSLYKDAEKDFVGEHKESFSKKIGIEVIESIMEHNHITIEELEDLTKQKNNNSDVMVS